MFCKRCQKFVVIYGVSSSAASPEDLNRALAEMRQRWENEGKLVLFNPPPIRPLHCPECGEPLSDERKA